MRSTEENRGFYGYEGYDIKEIYGNVFHDVYNKYSMPRYDIYDRDITAIMYPVSPSDLTTEGYLNLHITEHPELIKDNKKVYTHPSCTLPRESIVKKYNRCINPIQADIIAIPEPSADSRIYCRRTVVFVDENSRTLLYYEFGNQYRGLSQEDIAAFNRIIQFPKGSFLYDMVHPNVAGDFGEKYPNARLAEVGYYGEFSAKNKYLVDYMEMLIPSRKIVFQETLSKTLNDETNNLSFDTFMSIYDMLISADKEIRNVGLKTLATMDYANFKNSTICLLRKTVNNWRNDYKARNSTGVKYMMKILGITYPTERAIQYNDLYIRKGDFEMLERLWVEFNLNKRDFRNLKFMHYDENYKLIPRLLPDDNQ